MKKKMNFLKLKAFLSLVIAVTLLVGGVPYLTYAHNVDGSGVGVKALNCLGYQYVNKNTVKVFFDKGLSSINQEQLKLKTTTGTPVTISGLTSSSGSGWTSTVSPGGTTVTLTTADLAANTTYVLTISSTVAAGNSYGITLGEYWEHHDISFNFKTPNSDGITYSGAPTLTFIPTWNGDGFSANVEAIADMPIDVDLSQVKLQKSSTVNGTYSDVLMDSTLDTNALSGAECYSAQLNDARTCIFLPETLRGGYPAYNLDYVNSVNYFYKMVTPTVSNHSSTSNQLASQSNTFQVGADTAGPTGTTIATITGYNSSSVSLSWSDVVITDGSAPNPTGYKVYYSTDPYFNFVAATNTITHSGTTNSCTVTGLSSGQTYYFRIVPVNSIGNEGGFSPYVSQTTN
ncbi:MAG: fibronectin type III domain-containing protein [Bacillota bacterium]|nr:fibronectin type III domain-containing protein [Bacillota bacterium]